MKKLRNSFFVFVLITVFFGSREYLRQKNDGESLSTFNERVSQLFDEQGKCGNANADQQACLNDLLDLNEKVASSIEGRSFSSNSLFMLVIGKEANHYGERFNDKRGEFLILYSNFAKVMSSALNPHSRSPAAVASNPSGLLTSPEAWSGMCEIGAQAKGKMRDFLTDAADLEKMSAVFDATESRCKSN